jgi:hypothetical protein
MHLNLPSYCSFCICPICSLLLFLFSPAVFLTLLSIFFKTFHLHNWLISLLAHWSPWYIFSVVGLEFTIFILNLSQSSFKKYYTTFHKAVYIYPFCLFFELLLLYILFLYMLCILKFIAIIFALVPGDWMQGLTHAS